jgi:hypothetical protein
MGGLSIARALAIIERRCAPECPLSEQENNRAVEMSSSATAELLSRGKVMNTMKALTIALGVAGLAACNNSPQEKAADNIEANAEATADNLEEAADNATTDAAEGSLENQADATREMGDNMAEDMRSNSADTNLANGM